VAAEWTGTIDSFMKIIRLPWWAILLSLMNFNKWAQVVDVVE